MAAPTPFERDTAIVPGGPGRWTARCDERWFTPRGPNGGYLAAIVLRAMMAAVGSPARAPRSLTLHYARPPRAGRLEVAVEVERSGRRLTTLSARMTQAGELCVLALAAFSEEFPAVAGYAEPPPSVPPPAAVPVAAATEAMPPIAHRFEVRQALGAAPFSGADEALTGGWIGFADGPQPLDPPALAMLADAWLPAPFVRLAGPVGAPTIDLTVHFRAPERPAAEPILAVLRSRFAHGGFFEEDGELWSADGRLLAQSRQLALLLR